MISMTIILSLFLNFAFASNFIHCDVDAKVVVAEANDLQIKILKVKEGNSGFGNCGFKFGQKKKITLKEKRLFEKGDQLKLTYSEYGGMTPKGAVHSKIWKLRK
jgi:hypothetical protein